MRLYTNNQGDWVGTQAEAKKHYGKAMQCVEVPTDKSSLMEFLNIHKVGVKTETPVETTSAEQTKHYPTAKTTRFEHGAFVATSGNSTSSPITSYEVGTGRLIVNDIKDLSIHLMNCQDELARIIDAVGLGSLTKEQSETKLVSVKEGEEDE